MGGRRAATARITAAHRVPRARIVRPSRRGRSAARAGTLRLKTGSSSSCRSRTAAWPATASIATARAAAAAAAAAADAETAYPSSKKLRPTGRSFFSCSADAQRLQISYPNKTQNRPPARAVGLRLPSAAHADAGPAAMEALAERQAYIHNEHTSLCLPRNSAEKKAFRNLENAPAACTPGANVVSSFCRNRLDSAQIGSFVICSFMGGVNHAGLLE